MDAETLKAEIRKLSARATKAKMDLHDLAEDLPVNWTGILAIAQTAHDAYAALETARKQLKTLETK